MMDQRNTQMEGAQLDIGLNSAQFSLLQRELAAVKVLRAAILVVSCALIADLPP